MPSWSLAVASLALAPFAAPVPSHGPSHGPGDDPGDDFFQILPLGQNVLVILADDLGIDTLERYLGDPLVPSGASVPMNLTPRIDEIMDKGIRFTNAWAYPLCSPTRATIQTGRYGFRTGIGWVIENMGAPGHSLQSGEITLAELVRNHTPLTSYTAGAFGKWHLEKLGGAPCAPTDTHGYNLFDGTPTAVQSGSLYCDWTETICNPTLSTQGSNEYMPERIVDAAIEWIGNRPPATRWLCYLAPQSPYELLHRPPDDLQSVIPGTPTCGPCESGARTCYDAALQAFDTKIGELLDAIGTNWWTKATVIFVGDNGTPGMGMSYFPTGKQKATMFEGGVHVPFIIAGKAVHSDRYTDECHELVTATDIYRTVGKLAGATFPDGAGQDSVNLRPLLKQTPGSLSRSIIYSERFRPNPTGADLDEVAVRDDTFKLVWDCRNDVALRMHNLITDPDEDDQANILLGGVPTPGTPEGDAYIALKDEICSLRTDCACN